MSILAEATAVCPTCGKEVAFDCPASVNADRRPDLRAAILDGSLYAEACRVCGEDLMFEPNLTYLDIGRRQWILARPSDERGVWETAEREAVSVYDLAFGPDAPAAARKLGAGLVPRLVFGWPAMVEKLLCQEMGLDDAALEATKLAALAEGPMREINPDLDLRLTGEADGAMLLHWLDPSDGVAVSSLRVPRQIYVLVKGGGDAWAPLNARLAGQMYVDIGRVLRVPAPA
jgi:hypothetical protein